MNTRNKVLIITGIILLFVALIIFLIGGYLAGWDYAKWFTSSQAIWIYLFIGLYGITVLGIIVSDKIKGL